MLPGLKFRHRIGLLVSLAASALLAVATVTLILGRRNEDALSGIETRYVPLIELDRDLKAIFNKIPRALEDAASAAEPTMLQDADALETELLQRLTAGATTIIDNGGDPADLETELRRYYANARDVSSAIMAGSSLAELESKIEAMRRAQQAFATHLDNATTPNRRRMAAAFAAARATQTTSLWIDIGVASVVLALMAVMSWRLIRRTVRSLQAVSAGVERLARGEFGGEIDVAPGDELGDLAREANRTAVRLREYRGQNEREDWIKSGLAQLTDQIVGELDPATLGKKAMTYLAAYVNAHAANVYASDEQGSFRLLESLGIDRTAASSSFQFGPSSINGPARDHEVRVEQTRHGYVIVVPLIHETRAMGALEFAMADHPTERMLDLMLRLRSVVGTAFRVAESRARERELLVETQRQAIAAQASAKELEAFSYSVSHDLRAPLRGIDGFSQALLEDHAERLPPKGQEYLRRIRAAAQRMAELIDDLLRLSRVTRADFRRERVDLSAIVTNIVAELRRTDPERNVEIHTQSEVYAHADPRLIRITLENLLGNAWKFTSQTTAPSIEFGACGEAQERVFFVRDNGAGFDMQYADRLFGAFQRLHTQAEFPGTGIGLATVQRIILRHGGRIWVEAAVGQGATFRFTLPNATTGADPS